MKKSKMHKIQIRNRKGYKGTSTGASMEILVDGKRLSGAYAVKFEANTREVAKVWIGLYGDIEVDTKMPLQESSPEDTGLTDSRGKPVYRYVMSRYSPIAIDFKKKKKKA